MTALEIGIIADDLSGGAECAAHALLRVSRSEILLAPPDRPIARSDAALAASDRVDALRVLTVDTHSRGLSPSAAAASAGAAAATVTAAPVVVKKIDSLLRGNVAAETAAVAARLGRTPVVAVSNPAMDRIVRNGILHVEGVPLHETEVWHVEPSPPPSSVGAVLAPLRTVVVPQATVDAGVDAVAEALREIAASGAVAVCDAATDADLATIHEAATRATPTTLLVGSGAMADAAVRALAPDPGPARAPLPRLDSLLMVLGTRSSAVAPQLAQLAGEAAHVELIDPTVLLAEPGALAARFERMPSRGLTVVALDPTAAIETGDVSRLVHALADALAPYVVRHAGVFLSGGETARAVLDRQEVGSLCVLAELDRGTVVSRTPAGHVVVTRPGSFGAPDSLLRTARALLDPGPDGARSPRPDPARTPLPRPPLRLPGTNPDRLVATPKENP
jgi:4-hydroxythreonine-4-phosphate dehydrogenase